MGGDHGPAVTVPAALSVLKRYEDVVLILVGDRELLRSCLAAHQASENDRLWIRHTPQHVAMDELPTRALRNKKDSSMRVAVNLVKEGVARACVSAGNTGALMATSYFVLKTLPGISRPALIASFPTRDPKKG